MATDTDVQPGSTPSQREGAAFPLSAVALQHGVRLIWRERPRRYPGQPLDPYLGQWIYGGATPFDLFLTPLVWGGLALVLELPFAIRKDFGGVNNCAMGGGSKVRCWSPEVNFPRLSAGTESGWWSTAKRNRCAFLESQKTSTF